MTPLVTCSANQTLILPAGFISQEFTRNTGGGFDYLSNGDIIAISANDFVTNPSINIFDGNGDGFPSRAQKVGNLATPYTYGSFIRVSPNGSYALFGTTGDTNRIDKLDLSNYSLVTLTELSGNYGLVFLNDTEALISANLNYGPVNQIYYLNINTPTGLQVIAQISGTPSGPVAKNDAGDVYYVKSTYIFPAPPASSRLYKFSSAQIQDAITYGTILTEADTQIDIALDGGYNLAINSVNDIYVSSLSGQIFKVNERLGTTEVFCSTINAPNDGSFTHLGFYRPDQGFAPYQKSVSKLGVSFADITFSSFSFIELMPKQPGPKKYLLQYP